jgi:hypothetical protein
LIITLVGLLTSRFLHGDGQFKDLFDFALDIVAWLIDELSQNKDLKNGLLSALKV